jgi:hypothetical protein
MRLRILNLSSTDVTLQEGKDFFAAATAILISFSLLSGIWPVTSPVAGLILSIKLLLNGAIRLPPI